MNEMMIDFLAKLPTNQIYRLANTWYDIVEKLIRSGDLESAGQALTIASEYRELYNEKVGYKETGDFK